VHSSIAIESAITINSGQAVVIYTNKSSTEGVETKIVYGPGVHVLGANEWMHTFFWNIPNQNTQEHFHKSLLRFNKLRTIPDQLYFDIPDVRTADDAVLKIKLMIFFTLMDIEAMLKGTHDSCSELINCITSDIVDFVSKRPFEIFKRDSYMLNQLPTFAAAVKRAETIGYTLTKVVYRGYDSNHTIQDMHNSAIETRTGLLLKAETEKQVQELETFKLQCTAERTEKELELEKKTQEHKQSIAARQHEETLRKARLEQQQRLQNEKEQNQLVFDNQVRLQQQENAAREKKNETETAYLKSLVDMGVDVTAVLIAQNTHVDQSIQLVGSGDSTPQSHIHLTPELKSKTTR